MCVHIQKKIYVKPNVFIAILLKKIHKNDGCICIYVLLLQK